MGSQDIPHGRELARHVGRIGVVNPDVAHAPLRHALPCALDAQVERKRARRAVGHGDLTLVASELGEQLALHDGGAN